MRTYPQRVRDNILPLSVAGTLPEAFEEWSFTDSTIDHEDATETCQLCEQEQLRYHFQVRNSLTSNELWVGSQCILKFGLSVFENGQALSPPAAKRKLHRLMLKMRVESCVTALERLAARENNPILSNALKHYKTHKSLSPKFAFVVLWQLKKHGIDHSPTFFRVSLKRNQHKNDLRQMENSRIHMIWPALTASQRRLAVRLGHTPPGEASI